MRQSVRIRWVLGVLLVSLQFLQGQGITWRSDTLKYVPGDTLTVREGFMAPFSEVIKWNEVQIDSSRYAVNYQLGKVWIRPPFPAAGRVVVNYRYFQRQPRASVFLRRFKVTRDTTREAEVVDVFLEDDAGVPSWLEDGSRINKTGSISRGITVGNNQGLTVNSGLRLQMEGDLGGGLKIVGALTDENIPLQPEGTTQQLSDLDRIFVKLIKDPYSITLGDFEVTRKGSRFANLYRNVQGLQFAYQNKETQAAISGAVAKGKFHTNSIQGIEGVSGPYRLEGRNGERFFIVLAGSEVVYLNGKRMVRGENQDYVINYNTAELFFTPRNVITSVTRIVVDFEYTDQNFSRSLVVGQGSHQLLDGKLRLQASYARDADNPNAPFGNEEIFGLVRDSLALVGDANGQATTSGIAEVGYNPDELRYERGDTVIGTRAYERYMVSDNPELAVYSIFFSLVGQGQGNYVRDQSGSNQNVFRWVAPDSLTGQPRGDYAPIRSWVLPRLLQVADIQAQYQIGEHLEAFSESAISIDDRNRLSALGDEDNQDVAQLTGIRLKRLSLGDSLKLDWEVSHQYIGERYTNLDRIYRAEYNRVWDLSGVDQRANEHIGSSKVRLNYRDNLQLEAETGLRNIGEGRNAIRQAYTLRSQLPKMLQGEYTLTHIQNRDDSLGRRTRWLRQEGDIFVPIGKNLRLGTELWLEDRDEWQTDSTTEGSFAFTDVTPYLRTVEGRKFQLDASWNYRQEQAFRNGQEREKLRAWTAFSRMTYQPSSILRLQQTTSFRHVEVPDSLFITPQLQRARILNTNWQGRLQPKKRFFLVNLLYELTTEQLARREVRFVEVNPGQGQYVWLDSLFNNDGQQQVNEFEIALNPLVANYIRVVQPTQELFPTNRLGLSGNVRFDFQRLIGRDQGQWWQKAVRALGSNTTFRLVQNKPRTNEFSDFLVSLGGIFSDSSILDANTNFRQDFTFFQNNPKGDFRFSYQENQNLQFLATGDELRRFWFWAAAQRFNLSSSKSIEAETRIGQKRTEADNFDTRNFFIQFLELNPQVNIQFNRKFRLSTGYEFIRRNNSDINGEQNARVLIHKWVTDAKLTLKGRNNVFTKFELITMDQDGTAGFSADYELQEGFRPGLNGIWQAFITYYILKNIELNVTYDGRASPDIPVIHTGRLQVRAFF
ncbi:MAG: hypothetical protein AAGI38_08905 [Bacteroidota bacterium]